MSFKVRSACLRVSNRKAYNNDWLPTSTEDGGGWMWDMHASMADLITDNGKQKRIMDCPGFHAYYKEFDNSGSTRRVTSYSWSPQIS